MREPRPGRTALLAVVAVLLVAGVLVFTIPVVPCGTCSTLAKMILGANPKGETLHLGCRDCGDRRRVTAVSGWTRQSHGLSNPWLLCLLWGTQAPGTPRPFQMSMHTEEEDRVALPVLVCALRSEDEDVALRAGILLGEMGSGAASAAPELRAALRDRSRRQRSAYAHALGLIGAEAGEGVPLLMQVLREPEGSDSFLYCRTAQGLAGFGAPAKPAIPQLIGLLKHPVPDTRSAAALALGKLGPESKVAIPELSAMAKGDDSPAEAAREALKKLGVSPK